MKFLIPGRPVPLKRPRFGNGRIYDSQKAIKAISVKFLQFQYKNGPLLEGIFELVITFYFKRPRSKKLDIYNGCRPDLSNLVKYVEDIAINVLYKDDAIIARIVAEKKYDSEERTEFELNQLNNTMQSELPL